MRLPLTFVGLFVMGVTGFDIPVLAHEASWQTKFLTEYVPAEEKLKDFYGKIVTIQPNGATIDDDQFEAQ